MIKILNIMYLYVSTTYCSVFEYHRIMIVDLMYVELNGMIKM